MNDFIISRIIHPGVFTPTGIEFELSAEATVTITITDAADEVLATPLNRQTCRKGTHAVAFTLPPNPRGELFYRTVAEMAKETITEGKKLK